MRNKNILDRKWLEEFGGLLAFRTSDVSKILKIPKILNSLYLSKRK